MRSVYDHPLKAHLSIDDNKIVRYILHSQEYWLSEQRNPRNAAIEYLQQMADTFQIPAEQLKQLHQAVSFYDPNEDPLSFQLSEEKHFFDATTYGFYQTYHNVPIWEGGMSVTVKENPQRIVCSANNSHYGIKSKLPDSKYTDRFKQMFALATHSDQTTIGEAGESTKDHVTSQLLRNMLNLPATTAKSKSKKTTAPRAYDAARINKGKFFYYKYDAKNRLHPHAADTKKVVDAESHEIHPTLPLPPVPEKIKNGNYYLVAEIIFTYSYAPYGKLNWRALIEVETGSVLYLRALVDGVDALVFTYDPKTSTGDLTNTPDKSNAVFDPMRDNVTLTNLNAPVGGIQTLTGSFVQVRDDMNPSPPTEPTGTDFDFHTRTDDFAAANAYYHQNNLFTLIEDLGFPIATYFDGTSFPIQVDHRGASITINAACYGDSGGDGIGLVEFDLSDLTDTVNPLGRAVDKWVHWHEVGGHGILYDHVNSANFGFAHSAGDGLAALQNDPESLLRALPQRFQYAPFRSWPAGTDRWFNRDVASGWAWGGSKEDSGYQSEQILATCHFRCYQAMGGDSNDVARRWFASRMMTYLILRAVGTLTPATNPVNPAGVLAFCNALMAVDLLNWTSEGLYGGAYNKLIRWSFEKQGLFQPAGAATPVVTAGAPPQFDVYIDDGRHGEYPWQPAHWNNTSVWNRLAPDGIDSHQSAKLAATNYAYVKVKNRGTSAATNIVVKGYHCLPGAGLTWPTDFVQMTPLAGLTHATIAPNSTEEVIIGPFEWTPNVNTYGHDCMLMIASADGDASNIDNFTAGESIEEWRLVPNDNNIGQRNVNLVAAESGESLMQSLNRYVFYAGNPFRMRANMELKVQLPKILSDNGWKLNFNGVANAKFTLKPAEKKLITIEIIPGKDFTRDQIENTEDRDIIVSLYAKDMLMGGMTYRLDPNLKKPANYPGSDLSKCNDKASDLLNCLNLGHNKVKKVCVKKVSVDIEMDNDCQCD